MDLQHPAVAQFEHTYLSPEDVEARLPGVTTRALAAWRHEGRGPAYRKLGRVIVYEAAEVEEWVEAQSRRGTRVD